MGGSVFFCNWDCESEESCLAIAPVLRSARFFKGEAVLGLVLLKNKLNSM